MSKDVDVLVCSDKLFQMLGAKLKKTGKAALILCGGTLNDDTDDERK